jgi:hypothetical protein
MDELAVRRRRRAARDLQLLQQLLTTLDDAFFDTLEATVGARGRGRQRRWRRRRAWCPGCGQAIRGRVLCHACAELDVDELAHTLGEVAHG